jgi:hypothetical protein
MRHVNLKSVVEKLGIMSVYLLFLAVHLNFKYTLPETSFSALTVEAYGSHSHSNVHTLEASRSSKPVVQKLRMNKRYVHEDVYQVYTLLFQVVTNFFRKVETSQEPVPPLLTPSYCRALLRGPPSSMIVNS